MKGLGGFRGRRLVKARSLLPTRFQPPVVLECDGLRLRVTRDPLDVKIVRSVTSVQRSVYFPDEVGDASQVRLVVDLGAHHGIYTAVAAAEYPRARFVAVEPSLDALVELRRQVDVNALDGRVAVVPAALGAEAGVGVLSHDASGSWGATLLDPGTTLATERVVTLTYEHLVGDEAVDVLKSNAEGAEFTLVPELKRVPSLPRVLVLAVHPEFGDVDAIRSELGQLGYAIRVGIDGDRPVWVCSRP